MREQQRAYEKYAVMLDNFGRDGNGNPTAHHTVMGYAHADQALDAPTAELYQTSRRQQVGYANLRDGWATAALANAGVPVSQVHFATSEGSRAAGQMVLVYLATSVAVRA